MTDELDNLRKKDLGQLLINELKCNQVEFNWYYKRYTAEKLRTVIRNNRTHDIIIKLASEAGAKRNG